MDRKQLALKILLPCLVILLVALVTLEIKCLELHHDNKNGLLLAIALLLNAIPIFATVILGFVGAVLSVLLFTAKKKESIIIIALIVLCLLIPFIGFSVFVDIAALGIFIEVPVIAVVTLAVDIAALVLCCLIVNENRRRKINSRINETQSGVNNENETD